MSASGSLPAAVVFDCDGTLVDTETLSRATISSTLEEMGHGPLEDADFLAMIGRAWPAIAAHLQDAMGVRDIDDYRQRVNALFAARFDEVEPFEDVVGVARELASADVPIAVCTSSGRVSLDRVLQLPAFSDVEFGATVAREDTDLHKPDPAPYLLAAEKLGVDGDACVAIEDSPTGAASALAAGMKVIIVDRGNHTPDEFAHLDVTIVTTLTTAHLQI